jgi:hypothetical protein
MKSFIGGEFGIFKMPGLDDYLAPARVRPCRAYKAKSPDHQ